MTSIEWFYAQEGRQYGPISPEELRRMADAGELATTDLVWREGLTEWVPAIRVRGLFDGPAPAVDEEHVFQQTVSAAVPVEEPVRRPVAVAVAARPPIARVRNHPLTALLAWYRDTFHVRRVEAVSEFFDSLGHFSLYALMFLCLVLGGAASAKFGELRPVGISLAAALGLFVLQYTAGRINLEIRERLVVEPFGDGASRGISDTAALWSMGAGLLAFIVLVVLTVLTGSPVLLIDGLCLFVYFQFLATAAASPEYLGLHIPDEVTMRGQAVGIPKFAAKLLLAGVPVTFGLAALWGCFSMLYAIVLLFIGEVSYIGITIQAYFVTVAFAALPLVAVGCFGIWVVLIRLVERIVE